MQIKRPDMEDVVQSCPGKFQPIRFAIHSSVTTVKGGYSENQLETSDENNPSQGEKWCIDWRISK